VGTAFFLVCVQKVFASKSIGSVAVVKGGIWFSMAFAGKWDNSTLKWAAATASFQLIAVSSFIVIVSSDSPIWLLFCKKGTTHKISVLQKKQESGSVLRIKNALSGRISTPPILVILEDVVVVFLRIMGDRQPW
jgi:hypothetical protein